MVEPEIAFADLDDLADLAEDFLKYMYSGPCWKNARRTWPSFVAAHRTGRRVERLQTLVEAPFVRLDYADAIEILQRRRTASSSS